MSHSRFHSALTADTKGCGKIKRYTWPIILRAAIGYLGLSLADRTENIRRIGEMTKLFLEAGVIVMTAFISPMRADRAQARKLFPHGDFYEIYCDASLDVCEQGDVKGLYRRAQAGEVKDFTGIPSPYEEPQTPELVVKTGERPLEYCVEQVLVFLRAHAVVKALESV